MTEVIDSSSHEKSEEERAYEEHERQLMDEVYFVADRNADYIKKAGKEYSEIFEKTGDPNAEKVKEVFSNLFSGTKATSKATLETFFGYVNTKFPSKYQDENPFVSEFLENNEEKTEAMAEFEYRRAAKMQGENEGENINEIAKIFNNGNQSEYDVANSLRHLSNGVSEYNDAFSQAIVRYANDRDLKSRQHLMQVQGDYEGVLANSLFSIATTFDSMDTELSNKMFDPTITLATMATRGSEDLFDGIMDYLRFKMGTPLEKTQK